MISTCYLKMKTRSRDKAYIGRRYHGNENEIYCSSRCNDYLSRRCFLVRPTVEYKRPNGTVVAIWLWLWLVSFLTRVEVGSNTSTVTLRIVGGDEKWSLKSETVQYGYESQGTRTGEKQRWKGPAAYTTDRPVLSLERAPPKDKTVIVKQ
jgi:hypothetical protein